MSERHADRGYHGAEVAVIGMACRLPGARDVEELWRNLCDGVEAITFFTDEELLAAGVERAELEHPDYVKAAPILDDVDAFDAAFFDFTPREAELMDPQQRLFLECAWSALEHAGYGAGAGDRAIGVFAGGKMSTYVFNLATDPELSFLDVGLGNDIALLGMRTSYKLDLAGPSYFVQSACSTSLVAVHLACQSLLLDECQMALAGAVAVDVPHKRGYRYQAGSLASPDGHVRAFDAAARGTVFGSGLGVVVLKRLEDALADGDRIWAVIKGSATNNDGAGKASFTAPSVDGEARVILEALVNAEVSAESVSYVEAHGTGTDLGDPIEVRALTRAFRSATERRGFCALGSVKTNVGHLDAAAGISGLIKTVLALDRGLLPPSLNFEQPNPKIDFAASPFYVNTELAPWPSGAGAPRRAGVSAFGFGGTNAHVVLEQAPPAEPSGPSRARQLLLLSAKSESALDAASRELGAHLRRHPDLELADVAFTLHAGRRAFRHRRAVVAAAAAEAAEVLEELDSRRAPSGELQLGERPVAFLFSGQGSQHVGMARELYRGEAAFRRQVDECAEILRPRLGLDLRALLYPPAGAEAEAARRLEQTAVAQPALFVVELALARLWEQWGVRPEAMIGHSIGEYAAAHLAGVFGREDALALVAARGRLMQEVPAGSMLAVTLAEERLLPLLGDGLSLAAVNGADRCAVSGPEERIAALAAALESDGVPCRRLHTSHAFHSAMMEPILGPFRAEVEKVSRSAPAIPFVSNVTGTWITAEQAVDPGYWVDHLRRTVRFADGVAELLAGRRRALLEVGPGNALATLAAAQARGAGAETPVAASLPHPSDRRSQLAQLLATAGRLWTSGVEIDGAGLYAGERRHRLPLPTYPFERQRFWIEPRTRREPLAAARAPGRLRKLAKVEEWFHVPAWRVAPAPPPGDLAAEQGWLVFLDGSDLGAAIVDRLRAAGQRVATVAAGRRYARGADGGFEIDPGSAADYRALLGGLDERPDVVVHLWNVAEIEGSGRQRFERAQTLGYYSLLFLAQALAAGGGEPLRLVVASSRMHDLSGGEPSVPEKATLLGPCLVIPQEHQNVSCTSVDVDLPGPGVEGLAARLLAEAAATSPAAVVAYRGRRRWLRTYERLDLAPAGESVAPLVDRGVYLITGGLGSVGMLLAEHLARTVRARLALLGRSPLPAREGWPEWLAAHGEEDAASRKIRRVMALEELGAEVLVLAADVADGAQMRSALRAIDQRFGGLDGVLHLAGVLSGGSIYRPLTAIGRAESETQFGPKVYGLYVLEEALAGRELDFCLLLSSNAAVLGGLGFVAYAAANVFMDAFATDRSRSDPRRWISSDWDEWPIEGERALETSMAEFSMTREESTDAFARLLAAAPPGQVVVSTGDLDARLDLWVRRTAGRQPAAGSRHARPELATDYAAPRGEVERQLAAIWQEVLGLERVGIHDNFFDLGGHSLLATQVMSRLREATGVELSLERLFAAPTVAGLAEQVAAVRWAVDSAGASRRAAAEDREEGSL